MLQNFGSQVQGLFNNSLNNFKIAMQSALVLNNTKVNSDGTVAGAALGMMLGSVGGAIGAVVGGLAGATLGSWLGSLANKELDKRIKPKKKGWSWPW